MKTIPALLLSLLFWLILCAFLYHTFCCQNQSQLLIKDGENVIIQSNNTFGCSFSSNQMWHTDPLKNDFAKLVDYLNKNPRKLLLISGNYSAKETYDPTLNQLGLSRAENAKALLVELGANENQIGLRSQPNESLKLRDNSFSSCLEYDIITKKLNFSDSTFFSSSVNDNLLFDRSAFKHYPEMSSELDSSFRNTAEYLKAHPDRQLKITGFYGFDEDNNSLVSNLGNARALDIKNTFLSLGVNANQLSTDGELKDDIQFYNGVLADGFRLSFLDLPNTATNIADLSPIKNKSIKLYFDSDEEKVTLTEEQRLYFEEVISYLDSQADGRIFVIGHTDSQGSRAYNFDLSRKRANFITQYLSKNGIRANQISTSAKGSTKPEATNKTLEGRAMNRRVEIRLK